MQELVIDRQKWRTGSDGPHKTGEGTTQLLNEQGFMCCLGFECLRLGLTEENILQIGEPQEVDEAYYDNIDYMLTGARFQKDWVTEAIEVNDNPELTLDQKEALIESIFGKEGIEVKFIN